jgi:hypothetical protein
VYIIQVFNIFLKLTIMNYNGYTSNNNGGYGRSTADQAFWNFGRSVVEEEYD